MSQKRHKHTTALIGEVFSLERLQEVSIGNIKQSNLLERKKQYYDNNFGIYINSWIGTTAGGKILSPNDKKEAHPEIN